MAIIIVFPGAIPPVAAGASGPAAGRGPMYPASADPASAATPATFERLDAPVMTEFTSHIVPIPECSSCEMLHICGDEETSEEFSSLCLLLNSFLFFVFCFRFSLVFCQPLM